MHTLTRTRILALCTGLAALVLLGSWSFAAPARQPRAPAHEGGSKAAAPPASRAARGSPRTGGAHANAARYRFTLSNHVDLPDTPAARDIIMLAKGELWLKTASIEHDSTVLRGGFSGFELEIQQAADAPKVRAPRDVEREVEFAIRVERSGQIDRLYLDATAAPLAESLQRQVLAAWQLVRAHDSAQTWLVKEEDANGTCTAEYELTSANGIAKHKRDCRRTGGAAGTLALRQTGEGRARYELAEDPAWIAHAISDESLAVATNTQPIRMALHVELTLSGLAHEQMQAADLEALAATRLSAQPSPADPAPAPLRPGLEAKTVLGWQKADDEMLQRRTQDTLAQLFRERQDELAGARSLVEGAGDRSRQMMVLGALADVGTRQAQLALLDIARSPAVDASVQDSALITLLANPAPAPETLLELRELAQDEHASEERRELALMVLGGAARAAGTSGEGARPAAETVDYLQQRLDAAQNDRERALALNALGNSGAGAALDAARTALGSESADVRASAVDALRHVSDPDAARIIAEIARNDADEDVRRRAVAAMGYRDFDRSLRATLVELSRSDASPNVRGEVVTVLGNRRNEEGVTAVLENIAQNDPAEQVRELAQKYLSGGNEPPAGAVEPPPPLPG